VLLATLFSVRLDVTSVERLCIRQGHTRNRCPKKVRQEEVEEARGRAYAIKDVEPQRPNVVTGASYEVELAYGKVASTNTILKGCTLNLVNHIFEIDLMSIELGTFDVIIGMDWLVKHDAVIVYGEKVVRIPYGNEMLIVESEKGVSRLKARYYKEKSVATGLTLSLFGIVMIVVSKFILGTDVQRRLGKRKLEKLVVELMVLRMLSLKVRMWLLKNKVATMGLETVNQMPWTEMKQLMTTEFCPIDKVQRMEHELWNLKVKEYDVDAYIWGLTDNIKGEVTSSKPVDLNEAVRMAHKLME
nr:reverse transcriptase domain-containing protein [Tanacetum cinerariifolium]